MMRKTYAPSGIVLGCLLGFLIYMASESVALGIAAAIGLSVVGWFLIRAIEKLIDKGVDAGAAAVKKAIDKKKNQDQEK